MSSVSFDRPWVWGTFKRLSKYGYKGFVLLIRVGIEVDGEKYCGIFFSVAELRLLAFCGVVVNCIDARGSGIIGRGRKKSIAG